MMTISLPFDLSSFYLILLSSRRSSPSQVTLKALSSAPSGFPLYVNRRHLHPLPSVAVAAPANASPVLANSSRHVKVILPSPLPGQHFPGKPRLCQHRFFTSVITPESCQRHLRPLPTPPTSHPHPPANATSDPCPHLLLLTPCQHHRTPCHHHSHLGGRAAVMMEAPFVQESTCLHTFEVLESQLSLGVSLIRRCSSLPAHGTLLRLAPGAVKTEIVRRREGGSTLFTRVN